MNHFSRLTVICGAVLLSGCVPPAAWPPPNQPVVIDERERVLSECMTNYTDLLRKYSALMDENGHIQPKNNELATFIAEYQDVQKKFESVVSENKKFRERNQQLMESQQALRGQIQAIEDKLHIAQEEALHLRDAVDKEAPPKEVGFTTNPKTSGIILSDTFLFTPGNSELSGEGKNLLKQLAENLNAPEYKNLLIRVDGHTDSTPVVKTKHVNIDNWFLGARRAHQVLTFLKESGIEKNRLSLASFGEYAPLVEEKEGEVNPENRRVEIILMEKN